MADCENPDPCVHFMSFLQNVTKKKILFIILCEINDGVYYVGGSWSVAGCPMYQFRRSTIMI